MSLEDHPGVMRTVAHHHAHHHKRQLLKQQLKLQKRKTPEGKDRFEIVPIKEPLSFEKGFFLFIRAVQLLAQENEGVVLVGLAGPSGAGKTVFSEKVCNFMPGISLISMDNYNVAERVIDGNFDDPRITDYELLLENIASLRRGEPAEVPIYDFKASSRVGFKTVPVPKSRVVILEGIYALSERLRPMMDLRVSITGGVHFDLVKRVLRDIDRSGQPPEEIIAQISETVYPMYKAFIEPDLETAHLKITNSFNPFSGFQNACTYILKAPREEMSEEAVRAVLSSTHTETQEETYDIYLLPPGEDKETCVSYLRMRNRDGRYSLMFEEWVTDGPFVITPRITFEVSVRLLGGLMALGYEIAHILKRESRVFKDPEVNITVKMDKLEQLGREYVQIQGKDRGKVKEIGEKLGLKKKYIAKPYIEQIMLENLTKEVQAPKVPKDVLKERFRVSENFLTVSPGGGTLVTPRMSQASSSWSDGHGFEPLFKSRSETIKPDQLHSQSPPLMSPSAAESNGREPSSRLRSSAPPMSGGGAGSHEKEATDMSRVMDRLDDLIHRIDGIEARSASVATPRFSAAPPPTPAFAQSASALSNQISAAFPPSNSNGVGHFALNGTLSSPVAGIQSSGLPGSGSGRMNANVTTNGGENVHTNGVPSLDLSSAVNRATFDLARANTNTPVVEFLEEVRILARNQSRMANELESLNVLLRQTLEKDILGSYSGPGRGSTWRLEAVMSASAVVSLACVSALLFTFLGSRSSS